MVGEMAVASLQLLHCSAPRPLKLRGTPHPQPVRLTTGAPITTPSGHEMTVIETQSAIEETLLRIQDLADAMCVLDLSGNVLRYRNVTEAQAKTMGKVFARLGRRGMHSVREMDPDVSMRRGFASSSSAQPAHSHILHIKRSPLVILIEAGQLGVHAAAHGRYRSHHCSWRRIRDNRTSVMGLLLRCCGLSLSIASYV